MLVARPEHQVLICVARPSADPAATQQLRQLFESGLDWKYLLATAERHCLIPLLYDHVRNTAAPVPPQTLKALENANCENVNSNLFLTGELVKLVDFLKANAIHPIPFKGPTLALIAYGDIGSRQFGDIDFLIHKKDVGRINQLLLERGFKPHPQLSQARETALLRLDCARNFVNPKGVMVDVHWDLVERYFALAMDTKGFWDRLETVTVVGKQLPTLSVEDLLLVLCIHGFTHFWERLGWICDVAALLERRKQIDWQLLMESAETMGGRRILLLGLLLANDLLHASLPQDVLKLVNADAEVNKVAKQVKQQLFLEPRRPAGIFTEAMLLLRLRERKRDKLKSFFSLLAQPRSGDWMFLSLPGSLFFLYYLIRPLRLAVKYAAQLPGLLRDHETAISRSLS